jgi:hypothetical protein
MTNVLWTQSNISVTHETKQRKYSFDYLQTRLLKVFKHNIKLDKYFII